MKKSTLLLIFTLFALSSFAQEAQRVERKIYFAEDNAKLMVQNAVARARAQGKNVLISIGGNWCKWCLRFDKFVHDDPKLDSILSKDYVVYHLNHSPEKKNTEMLAKLGYPQRFGFPVFVVLNSKGENIHIQNSDALEKGNSYDASKVQDFLMMWNARAIDPKTYAE